MLGEPTMTVASMQDVRDAIAPVFAPVVFATTILASPLFAVALVPLTVVGTILGAAFLVGDDGANDAAKRVGGVVAGISQQQWIKLGICVALDFAGDASDFVPIGLARGKSVGSPLSQRKLFSRNRRRFGAD